MQNAGIMQYIVLSLNTTYFSSTIEPLKHYFTILNIDFLLALRETDMTKKSL